MNRQKTLGRLQFLLLSKNFPSSMNPKLLATCSRTSTYSFASPWADCTCNAAMWIWVGALKSFLNCFFHNSKRTLSRISFQHFGVERECLLPLFIGGFCPVKLVVDFCVQLCKAFEYGEICQIKKPQLVIQKCCQFLIEITEQKMRCCKS